MLGRSEGNRDDLFAARDANLDLFTSREKKRCIEGVFRFANGNVAHLENHVTRTELARRGSVRVDHIDHHARALHRHRHLLHRDPGPTVPHVTETREIRPHFLRGADGQHEATGAILHATDQHTDNLAVEIQGGTATLSALHGNVGPDVRGGEKFSLGLAIEASDHAETRRNIVVEGKADNDKWRSGLHLEAITLLEKRGGAGSIDTDQSDAATRVLGHQFRRPALIATRDGETETVADNRSQSVHGSCRIGKEAGPGHFAEFVLRFDPHDRRSRGFENIIDRALDGIGYFGALGLRKLRRPRRICSDGACQHRASQRGTKIKNYTATHSSPASPPKRNEAGSRNAR